MGGAKRGLATPTYFINYRKKEMTLLFVNSIIEENVVCQGKLVVDKLAGYLSSYK